MSRKLRKESAAAERLRKSQNKKGFGHREAIGDDDQSTGNIPYTGLDTQRQHSIIPFSLS